MLKKILRAFTHKALTSYETLLIRHILRYLENQEATDFLLNTRKSHTLGGVGEFLCDEYGRLCTDPFPLMIQLFPTLHRRGMLRSVFGADMYDYIEFSDFKDVLEYFATFGIPRFKAGEDLISHCRDEISRCSNT